MKIEKEAVVGWTLGFATAWIVGKIWIVPQIDWWEVLWIVVKGQVGM